MNLNIVDFHPGSLIEITDTISYGRKLAIVTESGNMYFDLVDDIATPAPIYEALNPVSVGSVLTWASDILKNSPQHYQRFTELQNELRALGLDTLTVSRGLYFAYKTLNFNVSLVTAHAKKETDLVRSSRQQMDRLIQRAKVG